MKRTLFLVLGTVLLFSLLMVANSPANASGLAALCSSDPASAPAGALITVTCEGFVPGEITNAWLTEPDGNAFSVSGIGINDSKADAKGVVVYRFLTGGSDGKASLGTWAMTVKGKNVIGIARFRLTGGTEGVSGATVTIVGSELFGSGFAPNEIVTIWFDFPNGDCSGNFDEGPGTSTAFGTDVKADASGNISTFIPLGPPGGGFDCAGFYHIVARGNTSHLGGDAYFKTPNHPVTTSAFLTASPSLVLALGELITFSGSGFAPLESVNCWETTPQGAVPGADDVKADASGQIAFGFHTGFNGMGFMVTEGATGDWFMTCRGNVSGRTAIAHFRIVGGIIDP